MTKHATRLAYLGAIFAATTALTIGQADRAEAQSCGGAYVVQLGDSLSAIADALYKDVGRWSSIYQSNSETIGDRPDRISVGMRLSMPCIDGLPVGLEGGVNVAEVVAAAAPLTVPLGDASNAVQINLLTADDFAPFTDRGLPQGGLFTEIVQTTMKEVAPEKGFAIHWVNDWSSHHEPLLSNALLDLGFPWFRPDCENDPVQYRCENLVFSEPVFEVLSLMFVNTANPVAFINDADMDGKTLCRPAGYATYLFDQNGRNWLADGRITLEMPQTIDQCFQMLVAGDVDGVVLNEFTGRKKIKDLGLQGQVDVAAGLPIAIDALHVIAHKSHPEADELMAMINQGLTNIKASGDY